MRQTNECVEKGYFLRYLLKIHLGEGVMPTLATKNSSNHAISFSKS